MPDVTLQDCRLSSGLPKGWRSDVRTRQSTYGNSNKTQKDFPDPSLHKAGTDAGSGAK